MHDFRKAIVHRKRVVRLGQIGDGLAHDKGILENYVFNSLDLGRQRENAGRARTGLETLSGQADP